MACGVTALLFLRFWRLSRDRLLIYFAAAFAALSLVPGIGPAGFAQLLRIHGSAAAAWAAGGRGLHEAMRSSADAFEQAVSPGHQVAGSAHGVSPSSAAGTGADDHDVAAVRGVGDAGHVMRAREAVGEAAGVVKGPGTHFERVDGPANFKVLVRPAKRRGRIAEGVHVAAGGKGPGQPVHMTPGLPDGRVDHCVERVEHLG